MQSLTRTCFRVFLLIFLTANGYILLSGSVCFWLASHEKLSAEQTRMFDTCNDTWNQGTNAIFRLLDNKVLELIQADEAKNSNDSI
ncbi:MAG: hypothetical protein HC827_16235 [Cyanobacteria bacterium RM1_2_2]|nr:hypothetical protein [Cyanobacteria bacterium RM1_2_2]